MTRSSRILAATTLLVSSPALACIGGVAAGGTRLLRRPERWYTVLTWTLPFHVLAMVLLLGVFHLSSGVVRAIASWKDLAVPVLLMAVVVRTATVAQHPRGVRAPDLLVGSLCALALAYFVIGIAVLQEPFRQQIYGLRDAALFLGMYFVGRCTPELGENDRVLRTLFWVGLVTSIAAILERLFVPPEVLVLIGVALYFQNFLGLSAFTTGNAFGLPQFYWSFIGGHEFRRVGSVYLSSQGFAIVFLLIIPAATLWLLAGRQRRRWFWFGYVLMWMALLMTVTRMSIIACTCELVLTLLLLRRFGATVWLLLGSIGILVLLICTVPGVGGFIWDTITWQTGSSHTHLKDWLKGLDGIARFPLGAGLGTVDQTAVRFGVSPLSADNQFFKYGVELGVPGLLIALLMMALITASAAKLVRRPSAELHRSIGILVLVSSLGIILNGLTAVVFNTITLSYLYFWLAGVTVTLGAGRPADLEGWAVA